MTPPAPYLSVIVPAYQAAGVLEHSLEALLASDLPREAWELIVVDDASTDQTSAIAARYADLVVGLSGKPRGPAYARNRGCELSRGEILVFIDSDVCVHRDTLRQFASVLAGSPDVSAVFGSYDLDPPNPGLVSRYRNLLHAYVHHANAGDAETFWAGCGAIRRSAFVAVGMFDEWHYSRPQVEDIELGRRLRRAGHRILLRPEIQGSHLKEWTFRSILATDFQSRGVPWLWLMLQEGPDPLETLNIRRAERWYTAVVGLALAGAIAGAAFRWPTLIMISALGIALVLLMNRGFYRFLEQQGGLRLALVAIPLHLLYYASNVVAVAGGWVLRHLFGEPQPPADVEAQAAIGTSTWPPAPTLRQSIWDRALDRSSREVG
jgi:glycosyltransferase involved in cell wall biosynthesis